MKINSVEVWACREGRGICIVINDSSPDSSIIRSYKNISLGNDLNEIDCGRELQKVPESFEQRFVFEAREGYYPLIKIDD